MASHSGRQWGHSAVDEETLLLKQTDENREHMGSPPWKCGKSQGIHPQWLNASFTLKWLHC